MILNFKNKERNLN